MNQIVPGVIVGITVGIVVSIVGIIFATWYQHIQSRPKSLETRRSERERRMKDTCVMTRDTAITHDGHGQTLVMETATGKFPCYLEPVITDPTPIRELREPGRVYPVNAMARSEIRWRIEAPFNTDVRQFDRIAIGGHQLCAERVIADHTEAESIIVFASGT